MVQAGTPPKFIIVCRVAGIGLVANGACVYRDDLAVRKLEKTIIWNCIKAGCDLLNVMHNKH